LQAQPDDVGGFGPVEQNNQALGYGSTPIVIDWTYQYQEGQQSTTDEALAKWYHYYEEMGEFGNGVLSFLFAHIEGGIRHVAIFRNLDALKLHAEITVRSPYY
jgi:hypothetical protein